MEIIVGAFVTLALAGLILGVIWGKNLHPFARRQTLTLRFDNVRGLESGDPVMIRGMEKGAVQQICLTDGYVDVQLWVDRDVVVRKNFQAYIESRELMGGKQITLEPGDHAEAASLDAVYTGSVRGDLNMLFLRTEQTLIRLDSLMDRTAETVTPEKMRNILANVEEATRQTEQLVRETRAPLRSSLAHLEAVSGQLRADSTAGRMALLITKLDTAARTFHEIGRRIESEQGTLGQLVNDRELYERLLTTSLRLDTLITDIKKNPKKYLHVSVF